MCPSKLFDYRRVDVLLFLVLIEKTGLSRRPEVEVASNECQASSSTHIHVQYYKRPNTLRNCFGWHLLIFYFYEFQVCWKFFVYFCFSMSMDPFHFISIRFSWEFKQIMSTILNHYTISPLGFVAKPIFSYA